MRNGSASAASAKPDVRRAALALLLSLLVLGFSWHSNRDQLLIRDDVRQLLAQACNWLGCQPPAARGGHQLQLLDHQYQHDKQGLEISGQLHNSATYPVALPQLQVTLLSNNGAEVWKSTLSAAQFLPTDIFAAGHLSPGARSQLNVRISSPPADTAGYRISLQ